MLAHAVTIEAPIRDEVLARRIARAHGWSRTGARILDRVVELAKKNFEFEQEDVGLFFREKGSSNRDWTFRRPPEGVLRVLDDISSLELSALAREIMPLVPDRESGVTSMTRTLGLSKLRAANRERLERVWDSASE
jgi:hypothetical protein